MSKKTHTNPLSKQEIEKLRKNPYVASVTANTVRFTEAFKELAYEKKSQGIPVMETMRQYGIQRFSEPAAWKASPTHLTRKPSRKAASRIGAARITDALRRLEKKR